jgi:hypothetical protein
MLDFFDLLLGLFDVEGWLGSTEGAPADVSAMDDPTQIPPH